MTQKAIQDHTDTSGDVYCNKHVEVLVNRIFRCSEKFALSLNVKKRHVNVKCFINRIICAIPEKMIEASLKVTFLNSRNFLQRVNH